MPNAHMLESRPRKLLDQVRDRPLPTLLPDMRYSHNAVLSTPALARL